MMILCLVVTLSLFYSSFAIVADPYTSSVVSTNVPPHGIAGFRFLTSDWRKIPMPSPSPIVVPSAAIANGTFATLAKQIVGPFELSNLTFYGLHLEDSDGYSMSRSESQYSFDNRIVNRYYVYLGKRVESFVGTAKFNVSKTQTKTCTVVGLARDVNVTSQQNKLDFMYFNFDYSVITAPFVSVRLNNFEMYPHEKRAAFAIYLDPVCSDLHQRYLEMFGAATERCETLQQAIREHIGHFVEQFTIKYLLEPHRIALEGQTANMLARG